MSRTYRCRVRRAVSVAVDSRDSVEYRLRLNDSLDAGRMNGILRQKLKDLGGVLQPDGRVSVDVAGVAVEVDPEARTAVARTGESREVTKTFDGEVTERSWRDSEEEARTRAEARVGSDLQREAEAARDALVEDARRRLADASEAIARTLRRAIVETEKEAVVRKAESLGKVLSVTEGADEKTGDRTVVIEVEIPE